MSDRSRHNNSRSLASQRQDSQTRRSAYGSSCHPARSAPTCISCSQSWASRRVPRYATHFTSFPTKRKPARVSTASPRRAGDMADGLGVPESPVPAFPIGMRGRPQRQLNLEQLSACRALFSFRVAVDIRHRSNVRGSARRWSIARLESVAWLTGAVGSNPSVTAIEPLFHKGFRLGRQSLTVAPTPAVVAVGGYEGRRDWLHRSPGPVLLCPSTPQPLGVRAHRLRRTGATPAGHARLRRPLGAPEGLQSIPLSPQRATTGRRTVPVFRSAPLTRRTYGCAALSQPRLSSCDDRSPVL